MSDIPAPKRASLEYIDELSYLPDSPNGRLIAVTPRELTMPQLKAREGVFAPSSEGFHWYTGNIVGRKFRCGPPVLDNIPKNLDRADKVGVFPEADVITSTLSERAHMLSRLPTFPTLETVRVPVEKPVRGGARASKSKRKQQAASRKLNRRK